jgi:chromosome segregation ATPase
MTTYTKEQLDAIRKKAESERTDDEKEALSAAERSTDQDDGGIDWEKAFQHPRFKELSKRVKDAEAEAARLRREREDAEAEALQKQGEFKTLYEQEKAKVTKLQSQLGQVEQYESTLAAMLDAQLKELPESSRKLVPDELNTQQKLNWISRNRAMLIKQPAPGDLGAGRRGGSQNNEQKPLNPEQKEIARRFGVSEEDYAKFADAEGEEES